MRAYNNTIYRYKWVVPSYREIYIIDKLYMTTTNSAQCTVHDWSLSIQMVTIMFNDELQNWALIERKYQQIEQERSKV